MARIALPPFTLAWHPPWSLDLFRDPCHGRGLRPVIVAEDGGREDDGRTVAGYVVHRRETSHAAAAGDRERPATRRVLVLADTTGFPQPQTTIAAGRIWKRADVEAWASRVGRLPR